jgi:hypothetical protein
VGGTLAGVHCLCRLQQRDVRDVAGLELEREGDRRSAAPDALHRVVARRSPASQQVFTPLFDPVAGTYRMTLTEINPDGALTKALIGTSPATATDRPFRYDPPDPDFAATSLGVTGSVWQSGDLLADAGEVSTGLRVGNNDQIMEVLKQDGTTWELRGNVHGGETLRSTSSPNLIYEVDKGDGSWLAWDGLEQGAADVPAAAVDVEDEDRAFGPGLRRHRERGSRLDVVPGRHDALGPHHDIPEGRPVAEPVRVDEQPRFDRRRGWPDRCRRAGARRGRHLPEAGRAGRPDDRRPRPPAANAGRRDVHVLRSLALTEDGETTRSPVVTQATTGSASTVTVTRDASAATGADGLAGLRARQQRRAVWCCSRHFVRIRDVMG